MAWLFEAGEAGSFDCYDGADGWGRSNAAALGATERPRAKPIPSLWKAEYWIGKRNLQASEANYLEYK